MKIRRILLSAAVPLFVVCLLIPGVATAAPKPSPLPAISSLSVYNGPPDTVVSIYGTNFGPQKQNSIVWFNGIRAKFISWSDTVVTFKVPAGVGSGYVGVQNDAGMSNGKYFIPYAAPSLSAATPLVQARGLDVTLTGSNFGTAQASGWVSFNGAKGTVKYWSNTLVVATVPSGATYGQLGIVQNGLTSNGLLFTPYWQPKVTALSANYTLVGNTVTITGTDFGTTPEKVVLNGVQLAASSWSDTQVSFVVPAGVGSGYVGILRGSRVSNGKWLFVAPRITSLSSWWARHGSKVTVTGQGFGASAGKYALIFGGTAITADSWSDTSVVFTVPANAVSGYVGFTDSQRAATSNGIWLLVVDPATITSVSPTTAAPGALITINGTNFGPADPSSVLKFNGSPLTVVSWSDTQITAYAPAAPAYGYVGVWKRGVASNGVLLNVATAPTGGPAVAAALPQAQMMRMFHPTPALMPGPPRHKKARRSISAEAPR